MLDADAQASWLMCCVGDGSILRTVGHRLGVASREEADKALNSTWLRRHWKPPRFAIVGVGVLSEKHRFYRYVVEGRNRGEVYIEDIADLLKMLSDVAAPYMSPGYGPVADLCQRLYFVDPPERVSITPRDQKKMKELIEKINERLVTVSFEQLATAEGLYVVAGGPLKARALYQLLVKQREQRVRVLATDDALASKLIEWARAG
jgi:hypothetical protein